MYLYFWNYLTALEIAVNYQMIITYIRIFIAKSIFAENDQVNQDNTIIMNDRNDSIATFQNENELNVFCH